MLGQHEIVLTDDQGSSLAHHRRDAQVVARHLLLLLLLLDIRRILFMNLYGTALMQFVAAIILQLPMLPVLLKFEI